MLNKEKYCKEIVDIVVEGRDDIAIHNNKPVSCASIKCEYCDLYKGYRCTEALKTWANSEYIELEVDWTKVPVDTPVLVWNENRQKTKRHFAKYEDGYIYAFFGGSTSWSGDETCKWQHAELAEPHPEWMKKVK